MHVTIRPAELADFDAVVDIATSEEPEDGQDGNGKEHFDTMLQSPDHRVWVADADGAVVGWLHAFLARRLGRPPFVEIGGLAVSERFRRVGIGSKLISEANGWARTQRLDIRVRCHSSRDYAHDFYRHHGYHFLKQQHVFEGNHD